MKQITNRLPAYDFRTSRSELIAFSSLGLVGAVLVVATVSDAMKFAQARDGIVTNFTSPAAPEGHVVQRAPVNSFTNVLRAHTPPPSSSPCTFPVSSRTTQPQPL